MWDEGAGGKPTPGLTELAKARVLGHVTHGTFAYDGNAWATPPSLAGHLWGIAPWHTHVFTNDISHTFGPRFQALYPSLTTSCFKDSPPRIVTDANGWASPELLVSAILGG